MYEFQHRPSIFKDLRPSFVKADHADDVGFVFGACFWDGHVKIEGISKNLFAQANYYDIGQLFCQGFETANDCNTRENGHDEVRCGYGDQLFIIHRNTQ